MSFNVVLILYNFYQAACCLLEQIQILKLDALQKEKKKKKHLKYYVKLLYV